MFEGLFLCRAIITQRFGENKAVYAKYGLAGHEGTDVIPDRSYWGVHSLEGGTVVVDDDDGDERNRAYGDSVRIQNPYGRVVLYAHMSENCVYKGMIVDKGTLLGIMGNTGNSKGAHVHLSAYKVNPAGVRLNTDNGFKGMVDMEKEVF